MKLRDSQFGHKCSIANLTLSELPRIQFVTEDIKLAIHVSMTSF